MGTLVRRFFRIYGHFALSCPPPVAKGLADGWGPDAAPPRYLARVAPHIRSVPRRSWAGPRGDAAALTGPGVVGFGAPYGS